MTRVQDVLLGGRGPCTQVQGRGPRPQAPELVACVQWSGETHHCSSTRQNHHHHHHNHNHFPSLPPPPLTPPEHEHSNLTNSSVVDQQFVSSCWPPWLVALVPLEGGVSGGCARGFDTRGRLSHGRWLQPFITRDGERVTFGGLRAQRTASSVGIEEEPHGNRRHSSGCGRRLCLSTRMSLRLLVFLPTLMWFCSFFA